MGDSQLIASLVVSLRFFKTFSARVQAIPRSLLLVTIMAKVMGNKEGSLTKTSLEGDDGNGYEVVWSKGDSFKIGDKTFTLTAGEGAPNGTFEGNAPTDNKYTVYYPSTYTGSAWVCHSGRGRQAPESAFQ